MEHEFGTQAALAAAEGSLGRLLTNRWVVTHDNGGTVALKHAGGLGATVDRFYGTTAYHALPASTERLCGRGCGHVFAAGEMRLSSRHNGDVCLKCTLPHDTLRVDPEDTHADEIRDHLAG